jgi:aspartate kinase
LKDLLVMKFGGTSVGSADRMRAAARLSAEQRHKRPVVIVVSAMSGITDLLIETTKHAEAGDRAGLDANMRKLEERHTEACGALLPGVKRKPVLAGIRELVKEFERITHGMLMLGDRPPRSVDEAIAIGERLSALMMAACLNASGTKAEAVNAAGLIVTDAVFGSASPLMNQTTEKTRKRLGPLLQGGVLPVVTGFNGATADGRPTTLGRGGSDFSASILSAALGARELWIWTDVDGIMTADPRLVPDAAVLDEVTYREAAELAYNGAKVLHPRTLAPLVESRIPVWSKNSFAPEKPGTKIVPRISGPNGARAVTSMPRVALISLEPAHATLPGAQVMARALDALARANVEVLSLSSSSYRQSFCFLVRSEELEKTLEALESALALELAHGYLRPIEVNRDVGLLAIVGEGMQGTPGLAGRIFTAISRERINIIAIAQGSSELTIAIVVRRDGLEAAVRAVHAECGMGTRGQAKSGTKPKGKTQAPRARSVARVTRIRR